MPADRIFGSSKSIRLPFGNAHADFPVGPFAVAAIRDVPVLAVFVFKTAVHRYKIIVRKVEYPSPTPSSPRLSAKQKAEVLAKNYVKLLEQQILANPTQWFNFYDFFVN